MTICPIAIAVGCQKCPLFKVCPLKTSLGDAPKVAAEKPVVAQAPAKTARASRARKPGVARKSSRSSRK